MEWWMWLLLIAIAAIVLFIIWWWRRSRSAEAPTMQARPMASMTRESKMDAAPMAPAATPAEPAPMPAEPLAALPAPEVPEADDLAAIEGIGPRIHDILHEAGIKTFAQLADTSAERIREILDAAEFKAPANPSTWPAQARLAAESKWQELKELQDSLKGGK